MNLVTESDRLARKAAWAVVQAGEEAAVAKARKCNRSTINRLRNGAKFGVFYRALEAAAQLSRQPETDAVAFAVTLQTEAIKQEFRAWTTADLLREWHRLFDREPASDATEERASRGEDWDTFCSAHMAEAALHQKLVAVTEILVHERRVNPKRFAGDGLPLPPAS